MARQGMLVCTISITKFLGNLVLDGFLELVNLKNMDFLDIGNIRFSYVLYI